MTRATTPGRATFGPMAFVTFLLGVAIGLALVAPVLPSTLGSGFDAMLQAGGAVVLAGVAAFAGVLVVLAVLYQGYLRA